MAAELPALNPLTAENTGPAVTVTVYTLITVSVVVTSIRFLLSASRGIKFGRDDGSYIVAHLLAVASGLTWHMAVKAGLGKHIDTISPSRVDRFFKLSYSAQILEIASMLCAKLAFAHLTHRVRPPDVLSKTIALLSAAFWAVLSVLIIAFQCRLPRPWLFEPAQCPTHGNLLYLVLALNAITDIGLAFWIIPCVWRLRLNRPDRILVISLFGLRVIILAPVIAEAILMRKFVTNSDQTRVTVNRAILNQATVYVSLLSAAIPRTNQFISRLHTDRADLVLPDFEVVEPGELAREGNELPLRLVPPNDSILTTAIYSSTDTPASSKESNFHSASVTVRKDVVLIEHAQPGE